MSQKLDDLDWSEWPDSMVWRPPSVWECVAFSPDLVTWVAGDGCGPVKYAVCEAPRYYPEPTAGNEIFFGERIIVMAVCCAADAEHQLSLKRFHNPDRYYWVERVILGSSDHRHE